MESRLKTNWWLRQFCLTLLLIWSATLWANPVFIKPAMVTDIRTSSTTSTTRLVLETIGQPHYIIFSLSQPDRLVLDIKEAHLQTASIGKLIFVKSIIKDLRVRFNSQYLRLVFDLQHPVHTKSFVLHENNNHYRLVLDLSSQQPVFTAAPIPQPKLALLPSPQKFNLISHHQVMNPPVIIQTKHPVKIAQKPVVTVPPVSRAPHGRDIIIVIDPGHGGKDPGATGTGGTHEKTVVLAIAKNLQADLNREPGFHAELTRTSDYYIPLRGRLAIARKDKADMFISIHADAFDNHDAMGASIFALSERGATSEAARWLAERENQSEFLGGATLPNHDSILRQVLIDLSQTNTISESLQIGASLLREVSHVAVLHHDRVEQAAFVVLKSPDIPSVLVETGFITTPAQERELKNPFYQKKIAISIMQGIKDYFVRNPPRGTLLAAEKAPLREV
jgi:N-acetylmuramoyl-L-alanine amidase